MSWRALPVLGLLLLVGCASTPAEDPGQGRIEGLEARVGRIDRILDNQSLIQLSQRVEALQSEVRQLNGRIDELQNANEGLRKQQRDLYQDLEQRLKATESRPASTPVPQAVGQSPLPSPADEPSQYAKAFDTLKAGEYAAAVDAFRQLAAAFPNGQLADNTQYWLGEAYYVMRDYDHAAACFEAVLSNWPSSRKAPDALLKLGYTQFEQKKVAAARATLQQVGSRYPGTDAARLAAERLQKMTADAR
ncbi:MAG: hypothetical protein RLZZ200_819 [Pseudomonadota bacterium]